MSMKSTIEGMMYRWMEKNGVQRKEELTSEERAVFDRWQDVLTREVKIDDLKNIMRHEIARLTEDLHTFIASGEERKMAIASARIKNYETLLQAMQEPDENRERLKQQLQQNLVNY